MNEQTIKRTAKKLIKNLKGKVDFASVEEYLKSKYGYKVIFFHTPAGDREVARFNCQEDASVAEAFTYNGTGKVVFINNNCSGEEKLYLLYHEAGHIALGHMDYPRLSARNKILLDIEADVFAHSIIRPSKHNRALIGLILTVLLLSIAPLFRSPAAIETASVSTYETQYVFVTPSGEKYHRKSVNIFL